MLVDAVLDILSVASDQIQPVPNMVRDEANDYVDGIAVLDGHMVTLLGIEKLTAGVEPAQASAISQMPERMSSGAL